MIYENSAITNTFVSVPADMSQFNGASYLGGIIKGVLDSAKFNCRVTTHTIAAEETNYGVYGTTGGSGAGSNAGGAGGGIINTPNGQLPPLALDKTIFLIKFSPEVMAREKQFS